MLEKAGIESARLEAQIIAAHLLGQSRSWVLAHPDQPVAENFGEDVLGRRLLREPLAYILGWREFYGRRFKVGLQVLIPRHETEVLIDYAIEHLAGHPEAKVLDWGTGSGCIACTLKLERPLDSVWAIENSSEALKVAQDNAEYLGSSVNFCLSDGSKGMPPQIFDLILSNPPYIAASELLAPELYHEPAEALFAEEDGLAHYRRIAQECKDILAPGGILLLELPDGKSEQVIALFEEQGWTKLGTRKDLGGMVRALALHLP